MLLLFHHYYHFVVIKFFCFLSIVFESKLWALGVTLEEVTSTTIRSLVCGLFQAMWFSGFYWLLYVLPGILLVTLSSPFFQLLATGLQRSLVVFPSSYPTSYFQIFELLCEFCGSISVIWNRDVTKHTSPSFNFLSMSGLFAFISHIPKYCDLVVFSHFTFIYNNYYKNCIITITIIVNLSPSKISPVSAVNPWNTHKFKEANDKQRKSSRKAIKHLKPVLSGSLTK